MFAGMEIDGKLDVREFAYQKVNAQRRLWQQRGELSRVTSETLLNASSTYVDLLTARTGEAIARDIEGNLKSLLEHARGAVRGGITIAEAEVSRIQAELDSQQQTISRVRSQSSGAAAKLIYLLGLDPAAELTPVDGRLVAFELVDATPSIGYLVDKASRNGPAVREMEGLLGVIQESIEKSKGPAKYLPIFELRMAEGAFGAGPGDNMPFDNRWDMGLQARWNVTEVVTARDRRRVAQAKVQQAHLAFQDLQGKLAAGVQEARETILSGREQISLGESQIRDARRAFELSDRRLRLNPQPSSYSEALLALEALGRAQANYLNAISSYDKAQLRLMVLLGPDTVRPPLAPAVH